MKMIYATLILGLVLAACSNPETPVAEPQPPEEDRGTGVVTPAWATDASIYEVNIRQYTPEGTFNAFRQHLPRLKELGVELLWIMPVQPIGVKNRKGGLGSYYSIKDYTAVNPEFGTMEDFKGLVKDAHDQGFKVILDWVGNHTAWDHPWMEEHPDWYTRDDSGKVVPPVEDWSDVADLNYKGKGMRKGMLEALKFWVKETDIDGYRCDVAMMVPMDFWNTARKTLDSIKPVFMLAEAEGPEFHEKAFDMTYGWEMHHLMNQVAQNLEPVSVWDTYLAKMDSVYPKGALRMYFTTNHDENSWNGTIEERMGPNGRNFFVLATTFPYGMPLIYSGQEAGLNKRLAFFEKDTIVWTDSSQYDFYSGMVELKRQHPALVNGPEQGDFTRIPTTDESRVYAFTRSREGKTLLVALNFSNEPQALQTELLKGTEGTMASGEAQIDPRTGQLMLNAHQYVVYLLK